MPAPSNDNFASAIALSTTLPGLRTADTNFDATSQATEPGAWGSQVDKQSVWYTFTPASTGRYRFALDNIVAAGTDTKLVAITIYSGSAIGSLTTIRDLRNYQSGSPMSRASVVADLTSGVTYRIQVRSPLFATEPANRHVVTYNLSWDAITVPSAPANDNIANAQNLGSNPADGNYSGTTKGATSEGWETAYYGYSEDSVWFRFHATVTESQEIHVIPIGNTYWVPYFEVYQITTDPPADDTDLSFVDYGDVTFPAANDATRSVSLVAGNDYAIIVSPWFSNGEDSDFVLVFGTYVAPSAPANDVRTALNSSPLLNNYPYYLARTEWATYPSNWLNGAEAGAVNGTTVDATTDGGEAAHGGYGPTRSVWYVLDIAKAGNYRVWVESGVDCVLSVYNKSGGSLGSSIGEDDDSGTGNWPELTLGLAIGQYWIAVDSKTAGTFRLKWQKQGTGTPPGNDNFANATVISTIPSSVSGTTVDATAEPDERESQALSAGPKDSVWYKYVATFNGHLKLYATCDTAHGGHPYVMVDCWRGTTLTGLVRNPDPPPGVIPGDLRSFFNHFDTLAQIKSKYISIPVVSGQTYYIRVQTEEGGSEDFTIFIDVELIYLDLQVISSEGGPLSDSATIYLDLQVSGVEDFHQVIASDAATVRLTMTPLAIWETKGSERVDSATVYLNLATLGGECYSLFHFTGEGEADVRWDALTEVCRWSADDAARWSTFIEQQPGC